MIVVDRSFVYIYPVVAKLEATRSSAPSPPERMNTRGAERPCGDIARRVSNPPLLGRITLLPSADANTGKVYPHLLGIYSFVYWIRSET